MQSVSPVFDTENVQFEKEIAKDQPQYIAVIGLPVSLQIIDAKTGNSKIVNNWATAIRFRFSDEDRALIASGQDLVVTQLTFGKPLAPMNLQICAAGTKPVFEVAPEAEQTAVAEIEAGGDGFGEGNDPSGVPLKTIAEMPVSEEPSERSNLVEMPGKPSAADLDAVAEEQSIADATGTSDDPSK